MKGNKRARRAERVFLKKYVFSLKREAKPKPGLRSWDPYEYITLAIGVVFVLVLAGWLVSDVFFSYMDEDINLVSPEMLAQEPDGSGQMFASPIVEDNKPAGPSTQEKTVKVTEPEKPRQAINEYTLKKHDTLGKIAKKNGINLKTLLAANPDLNPRRLKVGIKLTIPSQDGVIYKVAKGDTLGSIAKKYSVSSKTIAEANKISSRHKLTPSQTILLPGAKMLVAKKTETRKDIKMEVASRTKNSAGTSKHLSASKPLVIAKVPTASHVEASADNETVDESIADQEVQGDDSETDEAPEKVTAAAKGFINPTGGKLTSGFGYRRHPMGGGRRLHRGIDIANKKGTAIVSAKPGKVVHAGWYGLMGKTVIIKHEDGYVTYYGHMSDVSVAEGQTVRQGQKIGEMGSTGLSTGNHLHFEVRKNNVPIDPLKILKNN